ncbi:S8 family serine peptidase [uncultured Lacinutrix sp.]|uniref:S8 family peptidase n=1 Tax=uncultured Lacinutrix sp. TaxID=574032 RepID=UPI0026108914|nr:S8 family serine peptidase [uncultured Lacinutrix sp.]
MKKVFFLIVCSLLVLSSCSRDELYEENSDEIANNVESSFNKANVRNNVRNNKPIYSRKEIIIQYEKSATDIQKNAFRSAHGIYNSSYGNNNAFTILGTYIPCDLCPGRTIEKWTYYPNSNINIEHKLGSIKDDLDDDDLDGVVLNVDLEFVINTDALSNTFSANTNTSYYSNIKSSNSGVTVGVFDTGLNANFPDFSGTSFMYNATVESDHIYGVNSGWNFVENNHNTFDDNLDAHGSIVTSIIVRKLNALNIPFQIMPLKVADSYGQVSYFKLVCALNYGLPRMDIANLSIGWSEDLTVELSNSILSYIIAANPNTLIVASAGNSYNTINDNDINNHIPSGLPFSNILSIGSSNSSNQLSYFSNKGATTVDFLARGENIPFQYIPMTAVPVSGTSFSTPYVAAIASKILYESNMTATPSNILDALIASGVDYPYPIIKHQKIIN